MLYSGVVFYVAGTRRSGQGQEMDSAAGKPKIYWFNWPSHVGGADTKFMHLLPLLAQDFDVTAVPNDPECLRLAEWTSWMKTAGVKAAAREAVPERIDGWAASLCNSAFFNRGIAAEMKRRGARIAWSNEMMWPLEGELEAVRNGLIDMVLYASPAQRAVLELQYLKACGMTPVIQNPGSESGRIDRPHAPPLSWVMTGNWIDSRAFPFRQRGMRADGVFTVGRLSRADHFKFPDHFPRSYERLGLRDPVRFRVMGWNEVLAERWCEHEFDRRWELLPVGAEPTAQFLDSLDLFIYELSPRFQESWGRAVVEAMLSGAVPLIPGGRGHHFENLVEHGCSGFHCAAESDFGNYARALQDDPALLQTMSAAAHGDAVRRHCREETHRRLWRMVFE
jgi:glycosyltransferase involved in cell wall biosynthesis